MHLKTLAYVFLFAIYSTRGDNLLLSPRVLYSRPLKRLLSTSIQ